MVEEKDVLPRRNLGPAEYWGRVVEDRLNSAEKTVRRSETSLKGQVRSDTGLQTEMERQIESVKEALQQLEQALLLVPSAGSNAMSVSGFSLSPGWNRVLTFTIPITGNKTNLNIVANGRVFIKDDGPSGGSTGYFQWVFPLQYVSSEYGYRPGGFHSGIDFAGGPAGNGNPIYAPADGVVLSKGTDGSRGNYINLRHEPGLITRYFHMNAPSPLSTGTPVTKASTILGYVGNTGASQGAHLHWETYIEGGPLNEENYPAMNPRDFMGIYGGSGSGPTTGEYSDIRSRIIINSSTSLEFQPYKVFYNTATPNFIQNFVYPIHGTKTVASTAAVGLDIYSSADVAAESVNSASLAAFGVFA